MDRTREIDLDAALGALAGEVKANAPRPGPDLAARVLADAAAVGAEIAARRPQTASSAPAASRSPGLLDLIFGWNTGAVAGLALSLTIGIAAGMELDAADMPLIEAETEDPMVTAEAGFLSEELL